MKISMLFNCDTMNYPKKPGFNLYQSTHCAYITYSVKTWSLKILSVCMLSFLCIAYLYLIHRVILGKITTNKYNFCVPSKLPPNLKAFKTLNVRPRLKLLIKS